MSVVTKRLRPAISMFRRVAGQDSRIEQFVKSHMPSHHERIRGDGYSMWNGLETTVVQSDAGASPKTGIYLKGACDLPSLLALGPLIGPTVKGTVAVVRGRGNIAAARADVLLQTLEGIPDEITKDTSACLDLNPDYFKPTLFNPEFRVPGMGSLGAFPKDVVVLSLAPNVVRTLYRHKEHGFLVDPGGWWLAKVQSALGERETLAWFKASFRPVGKLSVAEFAAMFRTLVPLVRDRTGAQVLVTNVLTVEPGDREHNYQLRRNPDGMRRREFCLALTDLSRELGFHVLDVDRVLKRSGIERQVDFSHFPTDLYPAIAAEAARVLQEMAVL